MKFDLILLLEMLEVHDQVFEFLLFYYMVTILTYIISFETISLYIFIDCTLKTGFPSHYLIKNK